LVVVVTKLESVKLNNLRKLNCGGEKLGKHEGEKKKNLIEIEERLDNV
jgi:hypothetical protein